MSLRTTRRSCRNTAHEALGALKEAFTPPGIAGVPRVRVTRATCRARALIAVLGLAFWWLYPARTPAEVRTYLLLVGGLFVPYSLLLLRLSGRSEHWIGHVAGLVGDLTILSLFHNLLPAAHIMVMFGYLLILAFHASLGGILAGFVVTAVIMGLVLRAEIAVYHSHGFDAYTLVEYGLVLMGVSGLLHAVTREQRRTNQRLETLVGSLRAGYAEGEVKPLNTVLERRAQERTAELERIHAELHVQLELTRRQASALGEMSKRIASVRDEERRRLARDLHDGIQQQLVVMRMNLGLRPSGGPEEDCILREVEEELDGIIERVREVAQDIYPSILLDRGLTAALRSYAGRLPLPTRLSTVPDPLQRLPPTVEGTAYFVICEAVTNALKHSGGTELAVSLTLDDESLELSVRDDGRGFFGLPATGRGLVYMRDRVRSFGGEVVVRSAYPRGVEVQAVIPIGTGAVGPLPSGSSPGTTRCFAEGRTGPRSPAG